jgi:predicted amidophosphoribosyltransferase
VVTRLAAAQRAGAAVVLVDDIITTGSTLAAATSVLATAGVRVSAVATLAATTRLMPVRTGRLSR